MTVPTEDQLAAVGAAFEGFVRRFKLTEALGPEKPLNELDKQVLMYVGERPGCGPTDVARFLQVAGTTVSSSTDRLVKRGLLARERPEADRRAVALRLTAAGSKRVDAIVALHRELHLRMLEPLSPAERATFLALVSKMTPHDD